MIDEQRSASGGCIKKYVCSNNWIGTKQSATDVDTLLSWTIVIIFATLEIYGIYVYVRNG